MAFPVARVGNVVEVDGKKGTIITGSTSLYTDFRAGASISFSHNGQVLIYDEKDIGSEDDDQESDDGLAVKPAVPGHPTAAEIARSNQIKSAAGSPLATETSVNNTATPLPQDCTNLAGNVPYSYQLSPNFKLSDVTTNCVFSHQLVAQHGLSVAQIICNLKGVCINYLEPLAAHYGRASMIITSGFRPGASKSQHELGQAIDVQFQNISDDEYWSRALWIKDNVAYDQFILEYLGNRPWLHGSFSRDRQRKQILTAVTNGNYQPGLLKMR